ncbi:MAG: S8 family serine peptidase [Bacteroidota bacterium]
MELNNKKILFGLTVVLLLLAELNVNAQTKYWVKFTDKAGSPYSISNPGAFLTPKSVSRRITQNISIDMTDIPVNQSYINQVNATGAVVFQCSKWFNAAIVIIANSSQLTAVNSLSCVLSAAPVNRYHATQPDVINAPTQQVSRSSSAAVTGYNYGPSVTQVNQMNLECMHNMGFRGQNMTIAVIDDGFSNADMNPVFDSLRNEGRILGTRDIVAGNTAVYEDDSHGAMVLSCMAGNSPGNLIGTAPKANYYLFRSEDVASEKIIEENNWVVAAELADSLGVDIITTSLGYTTFDIPSQNHTYADLNGKTSVASIAATMAARKGIFLLNAAGNEGTNSWHYVGVPADADSICTVGSVNGSGLHSGFSSVGPTADGRIKPDVSTMGEGTYVCQPSGAFTSGNGTSFACPVMAGAVACLWQANPGKTNMQVLAAIRNASTRYNTPDNNYGWGIPNMCLASTYLNAMPTSISEIHKAVLKVFPNPAKDYIAFNTDQKVQSVMLTDVLGNTIECAFTAQGNSYKAVFTNTVAGGVYFLTITTDQGAVQSKFIKE